MPKLFIISENVTQYIITTRNLYTC